MHSCVLPSSENASYAIHLNLLLKLFGDKFRLLSCQAFYNLFYFCHSVMQYGDSKLAAESYMIYGHICHRLQLMCYKYLWDSLIAEKFPAENFFSYFDLNPDFLLSDDVKRYISSLGFNAQVLFLTFRF
jgi:hypothetical protein